MSRAAASSRMAACGRRWGLPDPRRDSTGTPGSHVRAGRSRVQCHHQAGTSARVQTSGSVPDDHGIHACKQYATAPTRALMGLGAHCTYGQRHASRVIPGCVPVEGSPFRWTPGSAPERFRAAVRLPVVPAGERRHVCADRDSDTRGSQRHTIAPLSAVVRPPRQSVPTETRAPRGPG
jgi:hypothetical protein